MKDTNTRCRVRRERVGGVTKRIKKRQEKLHYLDDLIQRKIGDAEKERLTAADLGFLRGEYERLRGKLQTASEASTLSVAPPVGVALHDLLEKLRLGKESTMTMKLKQPKSQRRSLPRQVPWWTDAKAAKEAALRAGEPCVFILNAESSAL